MKISRITILSTLCSRKDVQAKSGRHEKDWFLTPEKTKLCILQREGAATVVSSLLCVVYPRLPSSTCLLSEEYILRSGPKCIGSTYCWAPTSFKTVSLSLSLTVLPVCSDTGLLFLFLNHFLCSTFTDSSRETERVFAWRKFRLQNL